MTTRFNILLSPDGIGLTNGDSTDEVLYQAPMDAEALPDLMASLRDAADKTAPEGWETVLVLPTEQILFTHLTTPDSDDQHARIREGLEGLTPYPVSDLHFDWEREDEFTVQVAVVATETLDEAEAFADAYALNPVGFSALAQPGRFPRMPWLGATQRALDLAANAPTKAATEDTTQDTPAKEEQAPLPQEKTEAVAQDDDADAPLVPPTTDTSAEVANAALPGAIKPTNPAESAKQSGTRQLLVACGALAALTFGLWWFLGASSDEADAPTEASAGLSQTGTPPSEQLPQPAPLATPIGPVVSPDADQAGFADVAPGAPVETPELLAIPALPETVEEHAAPLIKTTPPAPSDKTSPPEPAETTAQDTPASSPQTELAQVEITEQSTPTEEVTSPTVASEGDTPASTDTIPVGDEATEPSPTIEQTEEDTAEQFDIEVIEGAPNDAPKIRPAPVTPDAEKTLAEYRPLARPDSILPRPELTIVIATDDTPGYRPAPRPEALSVPRPRVIIAVAPPIRPTARPASKNSSIDAAVREASQSGAAATSPKAPPRLPTSASIADRATEENALRLRDINLIGVFGSRGNRRALVRLSTGRILKLEVGDRLDGGKVSAITDDALTYIKRGKNVVLKMPKS